MMLVFLKRKPAIFTKSTGIGIIVFLTIFLACHPKSIPNKNTEGLMHSETGLASYYADKFIGKPTASGELYDGTKFTAAHKYLKFGTHVKVTNVSNGKYVMVVINDRGPFVAGRIIDLSKAAATQLSIINAGIARVVITY